MELFHTSPNEITSINNGGMFGSFLCFSVNVYKMSAEDVFTYKLEIDESDLIHAGGLFYHENAGSLAGIVAEVVALYDVDEDTAEDLISERVSGWDVVDGWDGDSDWNMQRRTAHAAKLLGYRGCIMTDEQGSLYMIDMLGHESELELID
ncbi:hypothetical protein [Laribacter hongkongensis]|uniref:hypothetical protein n=1 Tax=Laribacter hongkongensis TaxID=168471 RepID=UPI001EFD8C66|nr:hypothetical protein [Laribacter hongkongensis]MCG9080357.1 hypothetical protein [Laribacter hongkongensis]